MRKILVSRYTSLTLLTGFLLLVLAACGSPAISNPSSSSTTTATTPAATKTTGATAATAEQALLPMMTLVGQPTAKLVTGHHIFEVAGKIKNGDTKQHDIYVQALGSQSR